MARQRMINTKLWSDGWIRKLEQLDKFLFVYLLSNEHANICGIYELPVDVMCFETGFSESELLTRLKRLEPKVHYIEGWVCLKNFIKNQNQRSPKVQVGIKSQLSEVPRNIVDKLIGYGYGIDTLSHSNPNPNSNYNGGVEGYKIKETKKIPESFEIQQKSPFEVFPKTKDDFLAWAREYNCDTGQIQNLTTMIENDPGVKNKISYLKTVLQTKFGRREKINTL